MAKPNCYECIYRRPLPGSAHSSCAHPETKAIADDPMAQVLAIFGSIGRANPHYYEVGLNIEGDPNGLARGWFNWPLNFDPRWLLNCDGFAPKNDQENTVTNAS